MQIGIADRIEDQSMRRHGTAGIEIIGDDDRGQECAVVEKAAVGILPPPDDTNSNSVTGGFVPRYGKSKRRGANPREMRLAAARSPSAASTAPMP